MSGGTNQTERLPDALGAAQLFGVDETSLQTLLATSLRLAGQLHFVGVDGRVEGDWSGLLDKDESVLLAVCQSIDLSRKGLEFLDDLAAARPDRVAGRLDELWGWLRSWARALEATDRPGARLIRERAAALVASVPDRRLPGTEAQSLESLRSDYLALSAGLEQLQLLSAEAWEASLASGVHEPAAALLIAFCRVFGRVQAAINQFTERLTDFYYEDCLHMAPRGPQADAVHLVFRRDPNFADEVVVPAGTRFVTRPASGAPIEFVAERHLTVTDVQVQALCSLRLQRDPLISPECEFGYVTRAKVDRPLGDGAGPEDRMGPGAAPLLGCDVRGAARKGENARIGMAVSSPVLWLKEGERKISLTIWFDFGDHSTDELLKDLENARDKPAFSHLLGRLFARWVLPDRSGLDAEALRRIRSCAPEFIDTSTFKVRDGVACGEDGAPDDERRSPVDPLVLLLADPEPDRSDDRRRDLIRDELVENMFKLAVSTAEGWHEFYRPVLHDAAAAAGGASGASAMTLVVGLANQDPPVTTCDTAIHGAEWPTDAPVLRLTVNDQAGIYPFSLLAGTVLKAVDLRVEVQGLRDMQAFNQLGPIDPNRPFMPFGPLPDTASYVVVGSPELARKYVTSLTLRPTWAGLPEGGFSDHYRAYGQEVSDDSFKVVPYIMRDGLWDAPGQPIAVFASGERPSGRAISIEPRDLRARWRPSADEFVANQNARNGLVRLQLAAPSSAFGHTLYPTVLTQAMTAKTNRRRARTLPNPPYTPLVERITVDYTAETRFELENPSAARASRAERILHLRPFGAQEIYPADADQPHEFMPGFGRDGNLYIGLAASQAQGVLSLLFDLRRDGAVDTLARRSPRPTLEWSWLAGDKWRRLDDRRVLSDSTAGFLTSGVVVLDLPPGLTRNNRLFPGELFWLRLASDSPSACFAGLKGVRAQALRASRKLGVDLAAEHLPASTLELGGLALPGVIGLEQPEPTFGLRLPETKAEFRTRAGERLRHKQRASAPWDYERLVLERFPSVQKARCLTNVEDRTGSRRPGCVLVVVVPAARPNDPRYSTRAMRLDPLELDEMERYLTSLASPAVQVKVRNASYELIQVRCRVGLRPDADVGDALRRANAAIVAYLSPWHDVGPYAQFDWEVRAEDIETCIRQVEDVRTVKGISLIHVWEAEGAAGEPVYHFRDTAALTAPVLHPAIAESTRVRRHHPWSLALPLDEHFIEIDPGDEPAEAVVTGVTGSAGRGALAGVEIGRTFIVGGVI